LRDRKDARRCDPHSRPRLSSRVAVRRPCTRAVTARLTGAQRLAGDLPVTDGDPHVDRAARLPAPCCPYGVRQVEWMTGPGLAWVEGRPTRPGDAAMCMPAPTAFHRAAAIWTYHRFRARAIRRSAGRAEGVGPSTGPVSPTARRGPRRVLWPAPPSPRSLARAINSSRNLNGGNVLVDPGKPPELLDVVPLCRAAGYAHARFALWVAPRRGHDSVLRAAKRVWRGTNCSSSSDADDADRSGTRRRGEHDHRVSRRPSE
jgi:hypothetical protein